MVEFEADDALAAAAFLAAKDKKWIASSFAHRIKTFRNVSKVLESYNLDQRKRLIRDEPGVIAKFGVSPASIPDYLALVGDAADGYPGLRGWGAKSASAVLARYGHLEQIPRDWREWGLNLASPKSLAETLLQNRKLVFLFRDLATLRTDIPLFGSVQQWKWNGATLDLSCFAARLDASLKSKR
jgi:5'-3' exonuclease